MWKLFKGDQTGYTGRGTLINAKDIITMFLFLLKLPTGFKETMHSTIYSQRKKVITG